MTALAERMFRTRLAYQRLFLNDDGQLKPEAAIVLADLARFASIDNPTVVSLGHAQTDIPATHQRIGRGDVVRHTLEAAETVPERQRSKRWRRSAMSEPIPPTPPVGAPAPSGTGAPGANPPPAPWFAGVPEPGAARLRRDEGLSGPRGAGRFCTATLERLRGVPADRLLSLPEKPDAPEWDAVWNRLGRPEKPDGYGLAGARRAGPDRSPIAWPRRCTSSASKSGAAPNAEWNAFIAEEMAAPTAPRSRPTQPTSPGWWSEWGAKYDEHVELGRRAGREFGLSEDEFTAVQRALGSGKTLKLFARIGEKMAEPGRFDAGGGSSPGFDDGSAPARGSTRCRWRTRIGPRAMNGDVAARQEAERLAKIIAGA